MSEKSTAAYVKVQLHLQPIDEAAASKHLY